MTTKKGKIVKTKVLRVAVKLLDEKGYSGTGLNEILAQSNTSKGAAYLQFPGGKDEIVLLAIKETQSGIRKVMENIFDTENNPLKAIEASVDYLKQLIIEGKFALGCPVTAVGLELSGNNSPVSEACKSALQEWRGVLDSYLSTYLPPKEREPLSGAIFCILQGAIVLSRITGDTVHLDYAGKYSAKLFLQGVSSNGV